MNIRHLNNQDLNLLIQYLFQQKINELHFNLNRNIPIHTGSFEGQDLFIKYLFKEKKDGLFLDIACDDPIHGSNTYLLEKEYNWDGFCFDIKDYNNNPFPLSKGNWKDNRKNSKFIVLDATSNDLTLFLKEKVRDQIVDYISLDVDDGGLRNLSHFVIPKILDANIKFKSMTIEHEVFKYGDSNINPIREVLLSQGYIMLFKNITFDNGAAFEDWWIDPNYFDNDIISLKTENIYWKEAVEKIKILK
jgi:hypothetical protein